MSTQKPAASIARIGSDVPGLVIRAAPPLTLVRGTRAGSRSVPWTPFIASIAVIGASLAAAAPLTEAETGRAAVDATLSRPVSYTLLAPFCNTLDAISLFSQGQHIWFLGSCVLGYVCWRLARNRRDPRRKARARSEVLAALVALVSIIALYATGSMLPRPIPKLVMASPDAIVIDFHSHTRYSWDGRSSLSPEQSRRWHRASGFDVAYVTDHSTFAGAEEASVRNPVRAGGGTVMLSGIEVRDRGIHLAVLGTDARDWQSYTAGDLHEQMFRRSIAARGGVRPIVLFTLPGSLKSESAMSVDAIELSDAAPRGLAQVDADRKSILQIGHSRNQALVASSNNHGWASASPAWSVMVIPGWRAMTAAQLDTAIRREILAGGTTAVRVIDRRSPGSVSIAALSMTVPNAAWRILVTMSWPERASWLSWIWVAYVIRLLADRWSGRSRQRNSLREAPV